jgi:cysteine desulfurase
VAPLALNAVSAYLDHAATTPMRPAAIDAMLPLLDVRYANPSGAHRMARDARRAIDDARDVFAELIGARPGEVVFTSGGTESDNLAVFGAGRAGASGLTTSHGTVVCSAVEHHAVLDPVLALGGRTVAVDATGRLDLDHLAAVLEAEAARAAAGESAGIRLVSIMAANNEVGTLQPLADAAEVVHRLAPDAVIHTDAVQAFCWTDVAELTAAADLVSLSAHKFGGPKGVGVLVVRDGVALTPRQIGGGQERGHRAGTQNVAGIVAAGVAARLSAEGRTAEVERTAKLRDRLLDGLVASVPGLIETGAVAGPGGPDRSGRVAGTAHVCIEGVESEALLFLLERSEVYASAASSCSSGAMETSHVLEAMAVPAGLRSGSLRLSLGWSTTEAEVDHALAVVPPAVERLRAGGL